MVNPWQPRFVGTANNWFALQGVVSQDYEATFNLLTSVDRELGLFWDLKSSIEASLSPTYDLEQSSVDQAYAVVYELGGTVQRDYVASYESAGLVVSDFAPGWLVNNELLTQYATQWAVYQAADKTRAFSWLVLNPLQADLSLEWSLNQIADTVEAPLTCSWDLLLGSVSASFAPAWYLFSSARRDLSPSWDVGTARAGNPWFARLTVDGTNTWQLLKDLLLSDYHTSWDVDEAVQADLSLRFSVGDVGSIDGGGELPDPVSQDFAPVWELRVSAEADLAAQWTLFAAPVETSYAVSWTDFVAASRDLITSWGVASIDASAVANNLNTSWYLADSVQQDFAPSWDAVATTEADAATLWDMAGPVTADLAPQWSVGDYIEAALETTWSLLSPVQASFAPVWGLSAAYVLDYTDVGAAQFTVPADELWFTVEAQELVFPVPEEL